MGLLVAVDVYKGGVPVQHYEFSSDSQRMLRMGKLPSAQVRLDDAAASRIHAVIHLSPTEAVLTDMGAETGTYVNGRRVSKVRLSHGDQIVVGETTMVVGLGATSPALAVGPAMGGAAAPSTVGGGQAYATAKGPVRPAAGSSAAAAPARPAAAGSTVAAPTATVAAAAWPAATTTPAAAWSAAASPAAAPAWAAYAAAEPHAQITLAPQPAASTLPEPVQRLASKLVTLSPESLAEAERYVDWLNARQAGAAGAASHEGLARPAGAYPAQATPPRDTNTFIQQMKRSRRTQHLAIAGVMLLVVIALAVIALRAPHSTVPDETGRGPRAAGAPATPTAEGSPPTPPAADDKTIVYRLPKDQSAHDLAVELWQKPEHATLLLEANPRLTDAQATLAKDTYVRIPRSLLTPELEAKAAASLAPTPAPGDPATPTPAGAPTSAPSVAPATAPPAPMPTASTAPAAAPAPTPAPSTAPAPAAGAPARPPTRAVAAAPPASAATPPVPAPPTEPPPASAIPAPVPEPDSSKP